MEAKLIKRDNDFYSLMVDGIVMVKSIGMLVDYNLSLKNCQAIERGYDLDELTKQECIYPIYKDLKVSNCPINKKLVERGFKAGFQKALEILGDKKFSEEDMSTILVTFLNDIMNMKYRGNEVSIINQLLQSLQQKEWDCIVEMEKVKDETKIIGSVKGVKGSGHKITTYKSVPVFDENGCLILKRK